MHERKRGFHSRVVQVDEETAHLSSHEHALVHDGARGHGAHVEDLARKRRVRVGCALDGATAYVELTFKVLTCGDVVGATHKRLQDGWHAGTRGRTQIMRVDRNLAPEHQGHAALRASLFEDALRIAHADFVIVREEEHSHAVVALVGQKLALFLSLLAEEAMRDLKEHAGAVAGVALKAGASAMLEVHEYRKRVVEHGVASLTLQVRKRADAARIMLVRRAVKTASLRFASGASHRLLHPHAGRIPRLFANLRIHVRSFVYNPPFY